MQKTSQKFDFDNRLLMVEASLRQREFEFAVQEMNGLSEQDFPADAHQQGLYYVLRAETAHWLGNYSEAISSGLRASKILARLPLNKRYGRALFVLSKSYSAIGDLRTAERKAYDALGSYRRAFDETGQSDCLNELARIAFLRSNIEAASRFLDEAIELISDDERKVAQYRGNVGTLRTFTGQWSHAETDLQAALKYHREHDISLSVVRNLLALGYLHVCKREFVFAERALEEAARLIEKHAFKREQIIYLEFAGELALQKGESFRAKTLLSTAYHEGRTLAPESALVSQSSRRLAEVEYVLDNYDDAMKYGQKALEVARQLGEKTEVAWAYCLIAQVFAERSESDAAVEHIQLAVETARQVGDPLSLARILLTQAEIKMKVGSSDADKIRGALGEAGRIFRKLKINYWIAEVEYYAGVFACQQGNLARGFKKLSRSEKLFSALSESSRVRRVNQFLSSLAEQAVALSVSDENSFKVFGDLLGRADMHDLRTGELSVVFDILLRRTGADRAIIFTPDFESAPVAASLPLTVSQMRQFAENFQRLIGQEVATDRPTLLLDCRRDPYINDLLPDFPEVVASVIVVPIPNPEHTTSFVYIDKLSVDNTLNPFTQAELNLAVGFSDLIAFKSAELQKARLQEDNRRLKEQLQKEASFPSIITNNAQLRQMLVQVRQVVDSSISIAIEGETGSGKDLLARAIHYNSNRRDRRFISVNCAALPETLLESELFGYHRGAFTGADRDKPGLFEEADGGTFFLDEIADMPLSVQAKILRVLEAREVVRLGESVPREVNVRIISATNKNLKDLMSTGEFRSDLYYRLSALTFRLPPLRDRKEDIPLLVEHFLEGSGKQLAPSVLKRLVAYDWPGNIRELDNEIKKLILLAGDSPMIGEDVLSSKLMTSSPSDDNGSRPAMTTTGTDVTFSDRYSLYDYLAEHERQFIIRALKERNGVKKHAAAALNIPESTLRLKIKQYNIDLNRLDSIH